MPDDTSEQGERLLRPGVDQSHQWKEGEDSIDSVNGNDEEEAQWPASQRPPSWWRRFCASTQRIAAPVLTILTALVVVFALLTLLTSGSPSTSHHDITGNADTDLTKKDPVIVLHPEDHTHRESQTIHLSWNITKGRIAPDGVSRDVIMINGTYWGVISKCSLLTI